MTFRLFPIFLAIARTTDKCVFFVEVRFARKQNKSIFIIIIIFYRKPMCLLGSWQLSNGNLRFGIERSEAVV